MAPQSLDTPLSKEQPLVSIIIPAYNADRFIARTLDSLINQTYRNIEVLVVDDGSEDGTVAIVQEYIRQDARIQLLQKVNGGVASARNFGIEQSRGEFVAPIDSDDIAYPKNIERQVKCLLKEPETVGVSYVWSVDIDEKDILNGNFRASKIAGNVYATLLCHNFLGNASSTLIRRSCFDKVGLYSTRFKDDSSQGCEDWDLYLRMAQHYEFQVVPQFLLGYRKLPNSMSSNFSSMAKWHSLVLKVAAQRHCGIPMILNNLSRSNLYMYFAWQSHCADDPGSTFSWLCQALRAECITPFLRYSFYEMACISFFRLMVQPFTVTKENSNQSIEPHPFRQLQRSQKCLTVTDIENSKIKIRIKIFIWNMFHVAVSGIASFSQHRKFITHSSKR